MKNKRFISLTICWILVTLPGLCILSFAEGTNTEAEQHFEKANESRKVADYETAIDEYGKVISLSPNSKIACNAEYWIGQSYFEARQFDAALSAFQKLLDDYPTSPIIPSTKLMIERVQQAKKNKSLWEAVSKGDTEQVKKLISEGADVNASGSEGGTALLTAIFNDDVDMVKLLIDKGADCNVHDNRGFTPLTWAITALGKKDKEIVELLINGGANINLEDKKGGRTPVYWAAFHGSKRVFEVILAKLTDPNTIYFAALKGHLARVKTFLQGGIDANTKDRFGCTPLHWAVLADSNDVADFLIAKGANVNAKDNNGLTPLLGARRLDMIGFLISRGADVNVKDGTWGYTKLHSACLENDRDMAAFLISKGADVNTKNNWGMMPLQNAIMNGHRELVELLIANGADVKMGTPLHLAVRGGHRDIAELLISKGADVNAKDKEEHTPLWYAQQRDHTEISELLRKHGAEQ